MAKNHKISVAARNAMIDDMVDRLDLNTPPAKCEIRVGAPPATITTASSGLLLGTVVFGNPAFGAGGASVDGRADANAVTSDADADDSGDAGSYRVYQGGSGDTAPEWQGTAGEAGDTPDMVFNNKTIVAGGTIAITTWTMLMPEQ